MIKSMDEVTPRDKVQFGIAIGLMVFGCVVLLIGLLTPPEGQIHQSVLVAFGEIATRSRSVGHRCHLHKQVAEDRGEVEEGKRKSRKQLIISDYEIL